MNLREFLIFRFLPSLGRWYTFLLAKTYRIKIFNWERYQRLADPKQNILFCVWHENLLICPFLYVNTLKRNNVVGMVSRSIDGEIISQFLHRFGWKSVRGSSSRGGAVALIQMAEEMQQGRDGIMIPDGPRGPARKIKPGIIKVAQVTGVPILPCAMDVRRKVRLKSWDRLRIPFPFNSVAGAVGEPILVPPDASEAQQEELRRRLEEEMRAATEQVENFLKK